MIVWVVGEFAVSVSGPGRGALERESGLMAPAQSREGGRPGDTAGGLAGRRVHHASGIMRLF